MKDSLTQRKLIISKRRSLQSPDNISFHLKILKKTYLKNRNSIVLETINYWENKLQEKLTN